VNNTTLGLFSKEGVLFLRPRGQVIGILIWMGIGSQVLNLAIQKLNEYLLSLRINMWNKILNGKFKKFGKKSSSFTDSGLFNHINFSPF